MNEFMKYQLEKYLKAEDERAAVANDADARPDVDRWVTYPPLSTSLYNCHYHDDTF